MQAHRPNHDKVRELRVARGWSQQQLAEIAGVSHRTVQRLEAGHVASLDNLQAIAAAFDVEVSALLAANASTSPAPKVVFLPRIRTGEGLCEHRRARPDGRRWEQVSLIHEGDGNDETDIEFLPDGRLLATARLEVTPDTILGHYEGRTALAVARPPYTEWTTHESRLTRLDGPNLFRHDGEVYAVARFQPDPNGFLTRMGGVLSRKRTALYRVEPERLVWLSDLPSSADTSYAGVVIRDGQLFVDYYTSRTDRDWPWLLGMWLRTDVVMARIPLEALRAVSAAKP